MPSQKNQEMLAHASDDLGAAKGMFVIDYRGLSVKQAQALRRDLTEAQAQMKVYKNNIMKIALANAHLPELDEMLHDTCAFVFYADDPVAAAKVIKAVSKEVETVSIKGGIADGAVISAQDALAIADLPSREELIAKVVGSLQAPLSGLVRVCNGPAQGLVTALSQLPSQKDAA